MIGAPSGAGDDCGSCRDVLAGSAPARPTASGSAPLPAFHLSPGPAALGTGTGHAFALPACELPSLTLASLQTIVIRC